VNALAHAGHWAVDLLYLSPLLVLAVALAVGKVRERRRLRRPGAGGAARSAARPVERP